MILEEPLQLTSDMMVLGGAGDRTRPRLSAATDAAVPRVNREAVAAVVVVPGRAPDPGPEDMPEDAVAIAFATVPETVQGAWLLSPEDVVPGGPDVEPEPEAEDLPEPAVGFGPETAPEPLPLPPSPGVPGIPTQPEGEPEPEPERATREAWWRFGARGPAAEAPDGPPGDAQPVDPPLHAPLEDVVEEPDPEPDDLAEPVAGFAAETASEAWLVPPEAGGQDAAETDRDRAPARAARPAWWWFGARKTVARLASDVPDVPSGDVPPVDPPELAAAGKVADEPVAVLRARPVGAPPALARATAQDVRPWRGVAFAVAGHLFVVAAALLLVTLHMPVAAPEQVMVSVVEQTAPEGNAPRANPAPPVPALHPAAASSAMPLPNPPPPPPPPETVRATMPVPPPPVPATRPQAVSRPMAVRAAAVQGVTAPSHRAGQMTVRATEPARVDANSTVIYSLAARQLGEQGQVFLSILVQPDGRPAAIRVVKSSGYATLDEDARLSAATWRFQPAVKNGVPVSSVLLYWVRFQLQ